MCATAAIEPQDAVFGKRKSNLQEVRARGGELHLPAACHAALICGNDADKPRNLAKSVTVE